MRLMAIVDIEIIKSVHRGDIKFVEAEMLNKEENKKQNNGDEKQVNYMVLGMGYGLMAGSVGMCVLTMFGKIELGGVCLGMGLISGMFIGMLIKKNRSFELRRIHNLKILI